MTIVHTPAESRRLTLEFFAGAEIPQTRESFTRHARDARRAVARAARKGAPESLLAGLRQQAMTLETLAGEAK